VEPWHPGFLVAAELKIIPVKKYVRLHYQPVYTLDSMVSVFEQASRDTENNDFVEGLVYGHDQAVIMRGTFTDAVARTDL